MEMTQRYYFKKKNQYLSISQGGLFLVIILTLLLMASSSKKTMRPFFHQLVKNYQLKQLLDQAEEAKIDVNLVVERIEWYLANQIITIHMENQLKNALKGSDLVFEDAMETINRLKAGETIILHLDLDP